MAFAMYSQLTVYAACLSEVIQLLLSQRKTLTGCIQSIILGSALALS